MSHTIRSVRNFGIYSLPALLLAIAGALLMALLYYPAPAAVAAVEARTPGDLDQGDRQTRADALFAAMLADALRQLRPERDFQARTLMYRYPHNPFSAERPALLRIAPPARESAGDASSRPKPIWL